MTGGLLTRGFSDAAKYIEETTAEGRRHLQNSNALGIEATVMDELATVWEDCREVNWDGFQA